MSLPFRLTLQSQRTITAAQRETIAQILNSPNHHWHLCAHHSSLLLTTTPTQAQHDALSDYCYSQYIDYACLPAQLKLDDFHLLAMDMDSTFITIECLDEIADFCGRKNEVAAITQAAMTDPNIDFKTSLVRRVALLEGLDENVLTQVYEQRLQLSPGAQALVNATKQLQIKTLLVSGGFTFFTDRLKTQYQLDYSRANTLEIHAGKLTGKVINEIVDAETKARTLIETCATLGISPRQAIVCGDGSNDLKMMSIAGLSVAFRAKPIVRQQADIAFNFIGLDGLLNILR